MYFRHFPKAYDLYEGSIVSVSSALNTGNFAVTLPWAFNLPLKLVRINHVEPADKRTHKVFVSKHTTSPVFLFAKTDFKIQQWESRCCPFHVSKARSVFILILHGLILLSAATKKRKVFAKFESLIIAVLLFSVNFIVLVYSKFM